MLLKKLLIFIAISLYSVVPVVASDNGQVRGHWPGHSAKMLNVKAHQRTACRIAVQSSADGEGLISRYKREYHIAIARSLTPDQRRLVDIPSHRFRMDQSKGSGKSWGQGYSDGSKKRYGMRGGKGSGKRGDQSRGDEWQKNRKKKSFDSD